MSTAPADDLPRHMAHLPRDHRGFPVPWFVVWDKGEPFFPAMDGRKLLRASRDHLCWVCGEKLGRHRASVIGPMCAVNRIVSEPQSHVDCARYSATHCPFLSKPRRGRVPIDKYPDRARKTPAGLHIERNPGACCVWIETRPSHPFKVGDGWLFQLGEPHAVEWYAQGRPATAQEVADAIETGLPTLREAANREPFDKRADALVALAGCVRRFDALLRRFPL